MNVAHWESYADRYRGRIFGIFGGVAGVAQAWKCRGDISPDLISYLSLARALLTNGWTSAINGFWSPLYSWLLAGPMSLHLMSSRTELLWVHAINLGIFFGAMISFHVFMSQTLRVAAIRVGSGSANWSRIEARWYFTGCAIFLFSVLKWLGNSLCTPDLLVACFIFLSAGLLAAILCRDSSWLHYVMLGEALALGYLAKAAAFPMALMSFAVLLFISRGEKLRWLKCLSCVVGFTLVAGPFLYTLSKKEGHPTFGESGRVAFLMYGNGLPAYWLGEVVPKEGNSPSYVTTCSDPYVFSFTEVPPGVYFPSYEPSRWYAGLVPRLQLKQELLNLRVGIRVLGGMAASESDLILGFVLLLLFSGVPNGLRSVVHWWFLWLPATLGIVMFWMVHVDERFIAPFLVIGVVGLYSGVLTSSTRRPATITKILMAVLLVQGCKAIIIPGKGFFGSRPSSSITAAKIVDGLERVGISPGTKVALIGNPEAPYWAWMGQYSIVAEVPTSGTSRFLGATASGRQRVYGCLLKTGAQAALLHADSPDLLEPGWQKVGLEDLYVRVLTSSPLPRITESQPDSGPDDQTSSQRHSTN